MFYNKLRFMLLNGNPPDIRVLHRDLTEAEAFRLERELIARYGRLDVGTGCLCNHTDGGEGQSGRVLSYESRRKISINRSGVEVALDQRIAIARALAGRKESAETRRKKRESRADCLPVCSFDLKTGDVIKTYPSIGSAKEDGYQQANISKVLCGERRSHGNVGWRVAMHKHVCKQ